MHIEMFEKHGFQCQKSETKSVASHIL